MVVILVPRISFLIPAYNAAETLPQCLRSLQLQTMPDWQAVVVDDGSCDQTWEVLTSLAKADSRIQIHRQANGGAAGARNTAARYAVASLLCMLDADDWLNPDFIERMVPLVADELSLGISYCSYRRVTAGGEMLGIENAPDLTGDRAMKEFSSFCALAIHAAVFPKSLFLEVGGMDTGLQTCEEWDLWMRMAFAGAMFRRVNACLCYYRMKENSLSSDPVKMVRDTVTVTHRAEAKRLERGLPEGYGESEWASPAISQLRMLVWIAAASPCSRADLTNLVKLLPEFPSIGGYEELLSRAILHGLMIWLKGADLGDALDRWKPVFLEITDFLQEHSPAGTGRRIKDFALWSIVSTIPSRSFVLDYAQVVAIKIENLSEVAKVEGTDTLLLSLFSGETHIGSYVGPLWGDLSVRSQIRLIIDEMDAAHRLPTPHTLSYASRWLLAAMRNSRTFVGLFYRPTNRRSRLFRLLRRIRREALLGSAKANEIDNDAVLRTLEPLIERRPESLPTNAHATAPDKKANPPEPTTLEVYWERVFEKPDPWNYLSAYEQVKYQQTLTLVPEGVGKALELACAEGIFTQQLATKVGSLTATDISRRAIARASERCANLSNVEFQVLDLVAGELPPGQDLIVCSEVLYYLDNTDVLEKVCYKMEAALRTGGSIVTAHAHIRADEPDRTGFDWGHQVGVGTIKNVLSSLPSLTLEETIDTELYAIHRFGKRNVSEPIVKNYEHGTPLDTEVAQRVIWGPAGINRDISWKTEVTDSIPVLMYHRIAIDGPDALRRFRIAPEVFRKQMQFLRRQGYYTLTDHELSGSLQKGKPIPGRPIVLTFDDAYLDFMTAALPILVDSGFSANVYVVTEKVGGYADWDLQYGEPAPLLSWGDIQASQKQGINFGSHMASHRVANILDNKTLLTEAVLSRDALERQLGRAVTSLALPYGLTDFRVPGILAHAGYDICFTTKQARINLSDNKLNLPRLEVRGDLPLEAFVAMIGHMGQSIG